MAYSIEEKQKIFDDICDLIINGSSLRSALIELDNVIHASDFFRWLREDEEKSKQYARASEERAEFMREEIIDISDDGSNDWMEKFNKEGESIGWAVNGENIQRSKLRVDTRKWHMSKVMPKKYGDKIDVTSDGEKISAGFPTLEQFYGKVEKSNE